MAAILPFFDIDTQDGAQCNICFMACETPNHQGVVDHVVLGCCRGVNVRASHISCMRRALLARAGNACIWCRQPIDMAQFRAAVNERQVAEVHERQVIVALPIIPPAVPVLAQAANINELNLAAVGARLVRLCKESVYWLLNFLALIFKITLNATILLIKFFSLYPLTAIYKWVLVQLDYRENEDPIYEWYVDWLLYFGYDFGQLQPLAQVNQPVHPLEDPSDNPIDNFVGHSGRTMVVGMQAYYKCQLVEYRGRHKRAKKVPDFVNSKVWLEPMVVEQTHEVVMLPVGLVQSMQVVWSDLFTAENSDAYSVALAICKRRVAQLSVSADAELDAVNHATLISYYRQYKTSKQLNPTAMSLYEARREKYVPRRTHIWFRVFIILLCSWLFQQLAQQLLTLNLLVHVTRYNDPLFVIFVGPIIEELIRSYLPRSFYWYMIIEFFANCGHTNYFLAGYGWLIQTYLYKFNFKERLMIHTMHNFVSLMMLRPEQMMLYPGVLSFLLVVTLFHYGQFMISAVGVVGERMFNARLAMVFVLLNSGFAVGAPRPNSSSVEVNDGLVDPFKITGVQELYGIGVKGYEPVAFAPNLHNERVAVGKRVLGQVPVGDEQTQRECVEFLFANLWTIFPTLGKHNPVTSVPFEQYLRRSNASSSVKKILLETKLKLDKEGIDENTRIPHDMAYKWTTRKSFVKVENNLYKSPAGMFEKAPRLIQGAPPEFIVLVGPWIMAMQDEFKKSWGVDSPVVFTSGLRADVLANNLMDHPGEKSENDVSAWDSSCCRTFMSAEPRLARRFGAPRAVQDLMRANVDVHGVTSKGIKYRCEGTRKSGDPYTSVFNSLWNAMVHVHSYCVMHNINYKQMLASNNVKMLVQGDDNALSVVGPAPDFGAALLNYGFEAKFIRRPEPLKLEFCSNRLYPVASGYVFGPKPGRVMAKMGYVINPPSKRTVPPKSMVRGMALGLMPACYHIEPMRIYIERLLELTEGHEAYFGRDEEWKMNYTTQQPVPATSAALYEQIGWNPVMSEILREDLKKVQLGQQLDTPLMRFLCDFETLGPKVYQI